MDRRLVAASCFIDVVASVVCSWTDQQAVASVTVALTTFRRARLQ